MKKYTPFLKQISLPVMCLLLLAGCVKDDCKHTYKIYTPVYTTLSSLRAKLQSQGPTALNNPGKLYLMGDRIYLNEKGKGIHVIDNSNPKLPRNIGFINVPGNIDIAMKGSVLYADLYCDLAAIDISDPRTVTVKKWLTKLFPSMARYTLSANPDSIQIVTGWNSRDTTISCDTYNRLSNCFNCDLFFAPTMAVSSTSAASQGVAGSMARFATVGNELYAVDNSYLNMVNIGTADNPIFDKRIGLNALAQTAYAFENKLFLGTTTGLSVYDLQDPVNPKALSWTGHWRTCDPVITDGKHAFVTMYGGAGCGGSLNQMDVYDVSDLMFPKLLKTYPFTNPKGLSKDGNLLFLCDGSDGLKVFDATDVYNLRQIMQYPGIDTYDVITLNGIAYVVSKEGLYQFDYHDSGSIRLLSKLQWSSSK